MDYSPRDPLPAREDGRRDTALAQNATKIMWANVQLMAGPHDPLARDPARGTGRRNASRSRQTRLVISIFRAAGGRHPVRRAARSTSCRRSPRCSPGPTRPWRPLDKYRARFDQVSMRLTAAGVRGRRDAPRPRSRCSSDPRWSRGWRSRSSGISSELGAEGRLIEMQLEEMLTGVAAGPVGARARLHRLVPRGKASPRSWRRSRVSRTRTCSTSGASASCSATTAS